MLMTQSYTPQCINALVWFAQHEPVGWFDKTAPNHTMRLALERRGLIYRIKPSGNFGLTKFKVTEHGRRALREARKSA